MTTVTFESRVVLDGTQTDERHSGQYPAFESRVVLDGTQTGNTGDVREG